MEYRGPASTFSVSKNLSNGFDCGFSEKSVYDGVFSSPVNFKPSAIPSSAEDYSEIFGRYGASHSPSIPVLKVQELNEKDVSAKFRDSDSKLDYSKVFGGFGNLDAAISYEDIFSQPKRKASVSKQQRSPEKRRNPSEGEDHSSCTRNDLCEDSNQYEGTKKISMSYDKINRGITNGIHDTTHVAQLHAIPVYACLIDEDSSVKVNTANEPSMASHAHHKGSSIENLKIEQNCSKKDTSPPPEIVVQYPRGSKVHDTSDRWASNSKFQWFDENASDSGTQHVKIRPPETSACDSDNHTSEFKRAGSKSEIFKCDASGSGTSTPLPHGFDEFVDSNSEAATSVAALRRAIEDAQEKFKLAKESTMKGKEKFHDCVKLKLNDDFRRRGKRLGCFVSRSERSRDIEPQIICKEETNPKWTERLTVNSCKVALNITDRKVSSFSAHVVTETLAEPKTTDVESTLEELESKEDIFYELADAGESEEPKLESEIFYEFVDVENSEEAELESESVDSMETEMHPVDPFGQNVEENYWNPFKVLDAGRKTLEVVNEDLTEGKIQSNVSSGNGAYKHEEVVYEIKAVQAMQNHEENGDRCKVTDKLSENDNKVDLSHKQEECERVAIMFPKQTEPKEVSQFQEESEFFLNLSHAIEQCDLGVVGESVSNGKVFVQEKESLENKPYGMRELQEPIDYDALTEYQNWPFLNSGRQTETQYREIGEDTGNLDESKNVQEHICPMESTKKVGDVHMQDKVDKTTDQIHGNEEIEKRHRGNGALDEHLMLQQDGKVENLLNGVSTEVDEKNKEREDASEWIAALKNGTITHDVDETMGATEDENQMLREEKYENPPCGVTSVVEDHNGEPEGICSWAAATRNEKSTHEKNVDGNLIVTEDASAHMVDNGTGFHLNEHYEAAKVYVPEYLIDVATIQTAERFTVRADIVGQDEHRCVDVAETICNLVETKEFIPHLGRMSKNTSEDDVSTHEDTDECHSAFSLWERSVASKTNVEAAGPPTLSEQELKGKEVRAIKTGRVSVEVKENHHTTLSMEDIKADITNGNLDRVELEKECHKRTEAEKGKHRVREREKEKEKMAVERAIREAHERAFAEARERATVERATAEARRKVMSESQERLGKKASHANEKSLTEKAAMEARLKAERAAVERATAEARTRALERAMSEKAVLEATTKDMQHNASGSSNNFRYTKSFNHDASLSTSALDGYNGESSQRCKARSERHQRVMERAAKALAEKSMRDRLVQKEQEERNKLAELLDADIRRWSSGKAGNLRALLSTLQYILGPNSGWQPIPLTDIVMATAVKKAYRKATLFVHPDKLQQRGASIQQKYICEKVFDLLKEGWNRFNMEER